jgi:hypothetical protein
MIVVRLECAIVEDEANKVGCTLRQGRPILVYRCDGKRCPDGRLLSRTQTKLHPVVADVELGGKETNPSQKNFIF